MPSFDGFKSTDFSKQTGGVHWRSRQALGGLLAEALRDSFDTDFRSWAVRRRTEVHIARDSQYLFDNPWPHAKLFVYTPPDELAFGFYVEKADHPIHQRWDWTQFVANLEGDPVMRAALLAAMSNHGLVMTDYYQQETGGALGRKLLYWQGQLCWQRPTEAPRPVSLDDLARFFGGLDERIWCDLHLFGTIPETEAIALGKGVIHEIVKVLRSLVPVYEASITHK